MWHHVILAKSASNVISIPWSLLRLRCTPIRCNRCCFSLCILRTRLGRDRVHVRSHHPEHLRTCLYTPTTMVQYKCFSTAEIQCPAATIGFPDGRPKVGFGKIHVNVQHRCCDIRTVLNMPYWLSMSCMIVAIWPDLSYRRHRELCRQILVWAT